MHLFQQFFHCLKHLGKSVFCINVSSCIVFHFMISKSSNLPSRSSFILGNEKRSYTLHGGEDMEVVALVQFLFCLRNVAQTEMSALVRCHSGFANPLMTTFLVTCGVLHSSDTTDIVNDITYLLLDPLEWTYDAQHHLDQRKLWATLLSCLELFFRHWDAFVSGS